MAPSPPNVFSIPSDRPFLEVLVDAIIRGETRRSRIAPDPMVDLPRWTILLPTRRAVRELERLLQARFGKRACLMPTIRPIGDIEEDLLSNDDAVVLHSAVPDAITPIGRELLLLSLIDEWAAENPHIVLAQEIATAPQRAQGLAASLAEFVDGLETEDVNITALSDVVGLDAARHRQAILDFLAIAQRRLPQELHRLNLLGPKERQSRILRHEARRLSTKPPQAPIIAAGSTGSIPATRDLLKAIAQLPEGAVVLPGLDLHLDEESWTVIGPQHPQFILKQAIAALGLTRAEVKILGTSHPGSRASLMREVMRPPETTEQWYKIQTTAQSMISQGLHGITMVECPDRDVESLAIALMLRETLEVPGRTAHLITPDRDLALRVKQDLRRWSIDIDDSGGEPLIKSGGAQLSGLLLDAIDSSFSAERLSALYHHPMFRLGLDEDTVRRAVTVIELALFRRGRGIGTLSSHSQALVRARAEISEDRHPHPSVASLNAQDWDCAFTFAARAASVLVPLAQRESQAFVDHVDCIVACVEECAGLALYDGDDGATLQTLLATVKRESRHIGQSSIGRVTSFLRRQLMLASHRATRGHTPRLAILGLLEARLMRADVHILGGLNESRWPALPDSGPWLNRPMREQVGLQLPERSIGQTAHDFVQALCADDVRLVWSRRVGDAPALPSRWVLRLSMISDRGTERPAASQWVELADALDSRTTGKPCASPSPAPPVASRPRRLSVTQVEKLVRDPYAVYAQQVLSLVPLDAISDAPTAALRGLLFHKAIGDFLEAFPDHLPDDPYGALLRIAEPLFDAYRDIPLVKGMWWPRFERIAQWLIDEERVSRQSIARVHAEAGGKLVFPSLAGDFSLTGRADRIDIRHDGSAFITDYKTGTVPSGDQVKAQLAPQLPLEAAMIARGAFTTVGQAQVSGMQYVKISGGDPPGDITNAASKVSLTEHAERVFAGLRQLVASYDLESQAYLSRVAVEKDDEAASHDHLSRYREWVLGGGR